MANPEHLEILKQGVEAWNKWRRDNPDVLPDLIGADLRGEAIMIDLPQADSLRIDLSRADLSEAQLMGANLEGANFREAQLRMASLSEAILRRANFYGANLNKANLERADLERADLQGANLYGANLYQANLYEANLWSATLRAARLLWAMLDRARLTEACFWETQRTGWSIKGVICESAYWDEDEKERIVYSSGEFERLFAEQTRVRLFYKEGINPLEIATLPALIKHLEDSHSGCMLRLESIHNDAGGAIAELVIEDPGDRSPEQLRQLKTDLEATVKRAIEFERQLLAEEKQRVRLEGRLEELRFCYRDQQLLLATTSQVHIYGDNKISNDTYNISGQAGAVGPNAHAHDLTFNQIDSRIEQSIDLAALALELETLRQAMSVEAKEADHFIAIGRVAEAEKAAQAQDRSKAFESLKGVGKIGLDFASKVGASLTTNWLKHYLGIK